ncbi:MAG: MarR family transcriptional regulator [Caulobacterales bacterium]|nr:MarR family transcriptional regulator [Caulobacterales bacterium]
MTVYLSPEPHTVRGLAKALNIAKPAVVRALDTLGELDFVRRKRDEADRRSVLIKPTVRGSVFLTDLGERIERAARGLSR